MMNQEVPSTVHAQGGGGYGPPPGGYGPPPGGGYGQPPGGGYGQPGAPGGYGPPPGAPMPGGAPMAPPGGGPPPAPGGNVNPELQKSLDTWFIISIVSIVCGCGCLAAVPIYMTYAGKKSLAEGNAADAQGKLKIAKICVIVGVAFEILGVIMWLVWALAFGGMSALTG